MCYVRCIVLCCLLWLSSLRVDAFGDTEQNGGFGFFGFRPKEDKPQEEQQTDDVDPFKQIDVKASVHEEPKAEEESESVDVAASWFKIGAEMLDEKRAEGKSKETIEEATPVGKQAAKVAPEEEQSKKETDKPLPLWMQIASGSDSANVPKTATEKESEEESEKDVRPLKELGPVVVETEAEDPVEVHKAFTAAMEMDASTLGRMLPPPKDDSSQDMSQSETVAAKAEEPVKTTTETSMAFQSASLVEDVPAAVKEGAEEVTLSQEKAAAEIVTGEQSSLEEKAFEIVKHHADEATRKHRVEKADPKPTDPPEKATDVPTKHEESQKTEETKAEQETPLGKTAQVVDVPETTEPSVIAVKPETEEPKVETVSTTHTEETPTLETASSVQEEHETRKTSVETVQPAQTESTTQKRIASPEDFVAHLESMGIDTRQITTNVETPEGRVAILVQGGEKLKLENLQFEAMEGTAITLKVAGSELELTDVTIGGQAEMNAPRRSLKQNVQLKTGLEIGGGATVTLQNSTFKSATETMIRVNERSSLTCLNCIFENNEGPQGGVVRVQDSSAMFDTCHMTKNQADNGGAIYFEGDSCSDGAETSLTVVNTYFDRNEAALSGASIFVSCAKDVLILGCRFIDGFANNGGAAYVDQIETLQIEDTDFEGNQAETSGGGLYVENADLLTIIDAAFEDNAALEAVGGAGYISSSVDATFKRASFSKNYAKEGGALSIVEPGSVYGRLYIQASQFFYNKATKRGGAVLVQRTSTDKSEEPEQKDNGYVKIERSQFSGNSAAKGAGVFFTSESAGEYNLKIMVERTNFTQNTAEKLGGGIYCGDNSTAEVTYSLFDDNSALRGTNCAKQCSCHLAFNEPVQLTSEGGSRDGYVTNICRNDAEFVGGSSNGSTAVIYVFVALGVICAFSMMAVALVVKKRRNVKEQVSNPNIHRSLSHFVGPDRTTSILSISFLPQDGDDDYEPNGGPSLLRSQTFGEMDYYVQEGSESHVESFDHDVIRDQEERATLQQTISADDAFFDSLKWEDNAPAPIARLASIPEIASHPTTDD